MLVTVFEGDGMDILVVLKRISIIWINLTTQLEADTLRITETELASEHCVAVYR